MKQIVIAAITALSFLSCKKNATPVERLNENADTSTAMAKAIGSFINGPYGSTSGKATVFNTNGVYTLQLENMSVSNGPDLHVYLSKEQQPLNFIDLGKLKSTMGNQLYPVTGMPDLTQYKFALVHCQQYNHLFGSAVLQ